MEFFWEMLSLQETMFLLILTGVLIKKLKIIDAAGRKMLSDLLIDVILPCNIVESFLGGMAFPDGFARNCLLAVGLSAVIQLMSIYGSKLLFRKYPREQRSVLSYGIICSNSSFVGLPVARLLFGDLGVIYTSMFQIPLRFTMWTAGLSLFTSVSRKDAFRKLVRHPCIIAVFAGLLLMAAPVSLPGFLDSAVASVSSCTVPVSMFVIGTILADAPIRSMFSKPVLWYTCLRLVLYPLLLCVLLKPLHLDTTLTNVCILMTGMPAGSTGSILADKYDCDAVFASQIAFASTLCSILTIPLLREPAPLRALPLRDGGIQKTDCTSSLFFSGPGLSRDRPAKAAKAGGLTLREGYPCFWALYASPQFLMASRMGFRLYPRSVSVYSTRGGTSG